MNYGEQLPSATQDYLNIPNQGANRKTFGSLSSMAKSVIIPKSSDQKIEFSSKLGGLKTDNSLAGDISFKKDNTKSSQYDLGSYGNMYKSMMFTDQSTPSTSFDSYKNNNLGFETGYAKNSPSLSKQSQIDEIINRHKSLSYSAPSTPLLDAYLKTPSSSTSYNDSYSKSFTENVGVSPSSYSNNSYSNNLKSSMIYDNYTVDDYKNRDNLYGCYDRYDKISDYKSYDSYKYSSMPLTSNTTSTSSYSNNYNYGTTNLDTYSTGSNYEIPTSAFSKNKNYDYTSPPSYNTYTYTPNNYSTSNYSTNDYLTNNYSTSSYSSSDFTSPTSYNNIASMSNAERISNANSNFECNIKQSDFKVGKKLGKGQFGQVFLVQHKLTGFICALKIIPKSVIKQQKVEQQLIRQIKIQLYLRSNNLVALYGFFSDYTNVYLLMELCTDGHVFNLLKQKRRVEQPQVRSIVRDICVGLEYVHSQRIIHRDIKPENVIMQFGVAKLCDFGWAVFRGTGLRSTYCGTPLYTSPQLVRGEDYDEKIDIWAIGVLTYQLLIGKIPFKIYSEDDMNRILQDQITFPTFVQISYDAKDFILKTLDRSKGGTYLTADDLLGHPFLKVAKSQNVLSDVPCI